MKKNPQKIIYVPDVHDGDGKTHKFSVAVGDRVLTSKYGGTEVKLNDVDYILVDEDDILGIVK